MHITTNAFVVYLSSEYLVIRALIIIIIRFISKYKLRLNTQTLELKQ